MKYGADDNSKLAVPPADPVEWEGYDASLILNGENCTVYSPKKVTVISKDWFTARKEIGKLLHVSSLDNLKVEKVK